jgi:hypothetical protein
MLPAGIRCMIRPRAATNAQRIFQRKYARKAGRYVLAEAVADHGVRQHAPGHPHLGQCKFERKEGRLRYTRLV